MEFIWGIDLGGTKTEGVDEVKKHLFNTSLNTLFLKPKSGDSAGVFGAAALVM